MGRRRFFVPEVRRGIAELTGTDAEHLVRVLRAEVGQVYEISDNQDAYLAEIEAARKSAVSFKVLEKLPVPKPGVEVILFAALIKFDRFEWLVEKATELGVSAIQPFEAARTERGLAQASLKRQVRWEKIALEASQQAKRLHLPRVFAPVTFAKALESNATVRLLLDENPDAPPILKILPPERTSADRVGLMLGPEGGWTPGEKSQAANLDWQNCSLGPTVLRSETAAVAALAVVQATWADCS